MVDELHPTEVKPPANSSAGLADRRFTPGALLADRFRIVALLGKGGMGEVYRAEDVKLGQQVALKFLPLAVAADNAKLQRLYGEVRIGRQVSHPNVCRLHDVMEWQGHHFISMEYIDGEDLASLLRRIGQLPESKALDIARDLCAGVAAAHAMGIIHRDLKPANVMIDGRGTARITDFGLAVAAEHSIGLREIAGTPSYMAPEQLSGGEISARTDIYALGLILFEMFTGKRRFDGTTLGEIIALHHRTTPQSLSEATRHLDPAIQRVIVRALEENPDARPASIHSMIAALPGGDPLQAALDAGETPSPEMVAAAGETGSIRPAIGLALLSAVILLVLANAMLSKQVMLYGRVSLPKKPDVLADRAREILSAAGYPALPAGSAYSLGWNNDYFESRPARREDLRQVRPSPVVFYYRESPRPLIALQKERRITPYDPPLTVSGMANVELDASGRLIRFVVVPPEMVPPEMVPPEMVPPETVPPEIDDPRPKTPPFDWSSLIQASGLDAQTLRPVEPRWRVPVDSDQKRAWEVRYPGRADVPVRLETASRLGKPVWFSIIPPWQQRDRVTPVGAASIVQWVQIGTSLAGGLSICGALFLARRNSRRSRGDRRTAVRLALFLAGIVLAARALRVDHVSSVPDENQILFEIAGQAMVTGMLACLFYIAIEPYFRRRWPRLLIGWTRLLSGRWRDPMVGRDILIGAAAGCASAVIANGSMLVPSWFGAPLPVPIRTYFTALTELRHLGYLVLNSLQFAILAALGGAFVFLLVHLITRSLTAASIAIGAFALLPSAGYGLPRMIGAVLIAIVTVTVFRRFGVLATTAQLVFVVIVSNAPLTLDSSAWYFGRSLFMMMLLIATAGYAFWISLATPPGWVVAALDEE
jgi:serine/threonine-protein kinase